MRKVIVTKENLTDASNTISDMDLKVLYTYTTDTKDILNISEEELEIMDPTEVNPITEITGDDQFRVMSADDAQVELMIQVGDEIIYHENSVYFVENDGLGTFIKYILKGE